MVPLEILDDVRELEVMLGISDSLCLGGKMLGNYPSDRVTYIQRDSPAEPRLIEMLKEKYERAVAEIYD